MANKCLFVVEGGLGKTVMATAICKRLKEKYNVVYAVSPYVDVLQACSYVDKAFPLSPLSGGVYEDIIKDEDVDIFWNEPYSEQDFIRKKIHLFNAWCRVCRLEEYTYPMKVTPVLDRIEDVFPSCGIQAKQFVTQHPKFAIIQISGGQSPLQVMPEYPNAQEQGLKRNYPIEKANELVALYKEKFPDTEVFQYGLANEPRIKDTQLVEFPYLTWALIAKSAQYVFCIDSSLQHLCASQGVACNVLWAETKPEHFGYDLHRNYIPYVRDSQPYFKPLGTSPAIINYISPDEVLQDE